VAVAVATEFFFTIVLHVSFLYIPVFLVVKMSHA
jgi:hypothetical protein